jgi:hypothetical protein
LNAINNPERKQKEQLMRVRLIPRFALVIAAALLLCNGSAYAGTIYVFNATEPDDAKALSGTFFDARFYLDQYSQPIESTHELLPGQGTALYVPDGASSAFLDVPPGFFATYIDPFTGEAYRGIAPSSAGVVGVTPVMTYADSDTNTLRVTNTMSPTAELLAYFIPLSGADSITFTASLGPYETLQLHAPENFFGSAALDSGGQPIAVTNQFAGEGNAAVGGFATEAQEVAIPAIPHDTNGFTSNFYVQNLGSDSTGVTVNYYGEDGTSLGTSNYGLSGNQGFVTSSYSAPLGAAQAVVTSSDQPIAVTVKSTNNDGDDAFAFQGVPESDASKLVCFPGVFNAFMGETTLIYIRNSSGSEADVDITIRKQDGSVAVFWGETIPAGGSTVVDLSSIEELPSGFAGIAFISSNQDIVCVGITRDADGNSFAYEGGPLTSRKRDAISTLVFPAVSSSPYEAIEELIQEYASKDNDLDCFIQAVGVK